MKQHFAFFVTSLLVASTIFCAESNITAIKSEAEFDQLIVTATKPLIAQFHSGCSVCNITRRHLQGIVSDYPDINFVEVDIKLLPGLAQRYNVAALPTVFIFEPGNNKTPKHTIVGPDKEVLVSKINETLTASKKVANSK